MAKENHGKKALKAGLGYTVGNILTKGLSFLSAFIFARLMSPGDYGIYNTFSSYVAMLAVVIGFALHVSIQNARLDYRDRLGSYCSSVSLITLGNALVLLVPALLFREPLGRVLTVPSAMVGMIVAESFSNAMLQFYNSYLAVHYESRKYVKISLIYAVSSTVLSVILVCTLFSSARYLGRAFGTMLPLLAIAGYILLHLYRRNRPRFNREYWKYGLKISLPIVPHGVSQLILGQFDRIMISRIYGQVKVGFYSFANNIGFIYQVIATSLDTAWTPWLFEQMEAKAYPAIRKYAGWYLAGLTGLSMLLMLVSPEAVAIMGGSAYRESRYVVIPIVLSVYFAAIYALPSGIEYYYKKTNLIALGTVAAAILNIVLNSLFIPRFGYVAAAYTTVFCYLCYYLVHLYMARRIHGSMLFDLRLMLGCPVLMGLFTLVCVVCTDLPLIRWSILAAGLLAAGAVLCRRREALKAIFRSLRK